MTLPIEIRLIGCCILLNVVPKTVPLSGSSRSPLDRLSAFGRLASLEAMRLFILSFKFEKNLACNKFNFSLSDNYTKVMLSY